MTREKEESETCSTIMDLSLPDGETVHYGVTKPLTFIDV